jgi:WD40 repeat protein
MYYHRPPNTRNYYIPGELRVWDMNTGKELAALTGFPDALQHLAYSPDGRLLAAAHQRDDRHPADLLFWDVDTLRPVGRVHVRRVHDLTFTPDGRSLVFCTEDQIRMLDLEPLRPGLRP